MSLDRIDRKILELLQQNGGRLSNVKLASKVGLSPTPCLDRVRRLEREGLYPWLCRARRLLASSTRSTMAFIQVLLTNTSTANLREFSREMMSLPEVESCHMVAGGFDFLLKIRCSDMQDYQRFLGEKLAMIPLIDQTHTYVVIEEVKSETAISLAKFSMRFAYRI